MWQSWKRQAKPLRSEVCPPILPTDESYMGSPEFVLHAISLGTALAVLWILLSGYFEPLLLGLGLASVVVSVWLAHRMDVADHEGHPVHVAPFTIGVYWPWLVWQIIKSNWDVAKLILNPKMPLRPHVFSTQASQKTEVGIALYANSITLTPGTVTLATHPDGPVEVHAIDDKARKGVESLNMDKQCTHHERTSTVEVASSPC